MMVKVEISDDQLELIIPDLVSSWIPALVLIGCCKRASS
jgi:hypothetical protein